MSFIRKEYYTVDNLIVFDKAIKHIDSSEFLAYDTETTGLNVRKDSVIGFSFCGKIGQSFYAPLKLWNGTTLIDHPFIKLNLELLNKLQSKDLLMFNASFDVRITKNNLGIDLINSLVADVMLMKHTVEEEPPFGLKDIAKLIQKEIGLDIERLANEEQNELKENIKLKGGKATKTCFDLYMADLDIISKYAAADADLTLRVFEYYYKRLEKENLLSLFFDVEVMPLYKLVTIPMEDRGMYVDMPKLIKYKDEIITDIKKLEYKVIQSILSTDEGKMFLNDRLDEFEPNPSGLFAQAFAEHFLVPLPKMPSGKYSLTKKTIETIKDSYPMEYDFLANKNISTEHVKLIQNILLEKNSEYPININSKQQLGKIVFDFMGIKPLTTTEKGSPQFNDAMLDVLINEHKISWARELQVYNRLIKISGSYYERFFDEQEDGIFYPTFKQHATTSGRYGGDMQQLSRPMEDGEDDPLVVKYNNVIRELFIPKPGYGFIDDDYESLEPRVFADDAGDKALIEIFTNNLDMYSVVAIMAENITDASADKKDPNFLKNKYPDKRQNAKAYALGIRYGMKSGKLSMSLNISKDEAQVIIDNYFKAFPNLRTKMEQYYTEVKTKGTVTSKFGRVRHIPRVKEIYTKYGDDVLDYAKLKLVSYKTNTSFSELKDIRREYNNLLNNALNFPIQSAATSIVNRAAIVMTEQFRVRGIDAWVSLQIHDQIVVSVKNEHMEEAMKIVQDCMENTNKLVMPLIAVPQKATSLRDGH